MYIVNRSAIKTPAPDGRLTAAVMSPEGGIPNGFLLAGAVYHPYDSLQMNVQQDGLEEEKRLIAAGGVLTIAFHRNNWGQLGVKVLDITSTETAIQQAVLQGGSPEGTFSEPLIAGPDTDGAQGQYLKLQRQLLRTTVGQLAMCEGGNWAIVAPQQLIRANRTYNEFTKVVWESLVGVYGYRRSLTQALKETAIRSHL